MPYCHRCGTKLEENWRFCEKYGTPIDAYCLAPTIHTVSPVPIKPLRKNPLVWAGLGLVIILISAAVIITILVAPINPWSSDASYNDNTPNVHTLNLNTSRPTLQE